MLRLKTFWPVSHSQIYPLLAKLEEEGFVSSDIHPQSGKPDKKVYTLTPAGVSAVEEWIAAPAALPAIRDELSLKAYCVGAVVSPQRARHLFEKRAAECAERMATYEKRLHSMRAELAGKVPDQNSPAFGSYILLTKEIARYQHEIVWCRWVLGLLDLPQGANLLDHEMPDA